MSNPQGEFHTYKVDWTKDQITWYIDGNSVRTLNKNDAQGGTRFPQTPMNIRIGIWAGGDSSNGQGTIEWAGGQTDYSAAPFSMYIKEVKVHNANPAKSYTYTDQSGNSDSIKETGSVSGTQTRDSSESSTTTTSSSSSESSDATTTAKDASTTATTLTTATQSSSAGKTTAGSTTASSDAASSSAAGSQGAGSSSGSATSTSGSGSGSGSGSESGSGSGSGASASASGSGSATGSGSAPTSTFNAAAKVAANYMGPLSLLALVSAFIQL